MKNSKEMADSVFRIRDAYIEKRNKRRLIIKRTALISSTACMLALTIAGINLAKPGRQHSTDIEVIGTSDVTGEVQTAPDIRTSAMSAAPAAKNTTSAALTQQTSKSEMTSETETAPTEAQTEEETAQAEEQTENGTALTETTKPVTTTRSPALTTASPSVPNSTTAVVCVTESDTGHITVETTSPAETTGPAVVTSSPEVQTTKICYRYQYVEVLKGIYASADCQVMEVELGERISSADIVSDDSLLMLNASFYSINGSAHDKAIAIKFNGYDGYWFYKKV